MLRLASLCEGDEEELAQVECLNRGKSITPTRQIEVKMYSEFLRYYAGWVDKIQGRTIENDSVLSIARHEPAGVCGAIVPWNL